MTLYTPDDLYAANDAWGASCGPGALAAILQVPVMGLRPLFPKPWTTPTVMSAALAARGVRFKQEDGMQLALAPGRGLAFIQLCGTWDNAPEKVKYRHTHWIAFTRCEDGHHVYDVNAPPAGGWQHARAWGTGTMAQTCARHRGANGLWHPRLVMEVLP